MASSPSAQANVIIDRETWLAVAWATVCRYTGQASGDPHISVGFPVSPGTRQRLRSAPAQMVSGGRSRDGVPHIFVSPVLSNGAQAVAALLWLVKEHGTATQDELRDGAMLAPDPPPPSSVAKDEVFKAWFTSADQTFIDTCRAIAQECENISGSKYEDLHSALKGYQARRARKSLTKLFCRNCGWIAYATKRNVPWTGHNCPLPPTHTPTGSGGQPGQQDVDGDVDLTPATGSGRGQGQGGSSAQDVAWADDDGDDGQEGDGDETDGPDNDSVSQGGGDDGDEGSSGGDQQEGSTGGQASTQAGGKGVGHGGGVVPRSVAMDNMLKVLRQSAKAQHPDGPCTDPTCIVCMSTI